MKIEHKFRYWLIANLVLLSGSLLMPWFFWGFEPPPDSIPIAGWYFIFTRIINAVIQLSQSGFAWLGVLDFVQGVAGIFVMGYVVFKTLSLAKPKGHKAISLILLIVMVVVVFLSRDFENLLFKLLLPGYWLLIVGLLSSAIFEWQRSLVIDVASPL